MDNKKTVSINIEKLIETFSCKFKDYIYINDINLKEIVKDFLIECIEKSKDESIFNDFQLRLKCLEIVAGDKNIPIEAYKFKTDDLVKYIKTGEL